MRFQTEVSELLHVYQDGWPWGKWRETAAGTCPGGEVEKRRPAAYMCPFWLAPDMPGGLCPQYLSLL